MQIQVREVIQAGELIGQVPETFAVAEPRYVSGRTGGVVAGALPLLYGMAEGIVQGATYEPEPAEAERPPARPAMGVRRSRQLDGVGYRPGS